MFYCCSGDPRAHNAARLDMPGLAIWDARLIPYAVVMWIGLESDEPAVVDFLLVILVSAV